MDATVGHAAILFMNAYSRYNQIQMYSHDEEKISLMNDQGLFCYKIIPFGLKNAMATY